MIPIELKFIISIASCCALILASDEAFSQSAGAGTGDTVASDNGYFFELKAAQRSELLRKLREIRPGDSYATVIKILGKPTYDQRLFGKDGNFKARVVSYYVKKWRRNIVNEKRDQLIRLEFNRSDILVEVTSNVEK